MSYQKKISFVVLALTLAFSPIVLAEPKAYVEPKKGFFSQPKLLVNGKKFSPQFFRQSGFKFAEEMKDNPEAYKLAKKHECYSVWASGLLWGGLGASIIYSSVTASDDYKSGIYWGIFGAGFIGSIFFQQSAQINLQKAINSYNGVGSQGNNLEFNVTPLQDGAALVARYEY